MPQVPASSIKMTDIAAELGISQSSVSLDNCRAQSNAYTDGTANHTGVNTTNNVTATPNTMAEWAGYVHATGMGTINYNVRMALSTSWGLQQRSLDITVDETAFASGGLAIWRSHDATNTYIKAKAVGDQLNRYKYHNGSAVNNLSTTSTGTVIITIPVGSNDVSGGVTITAVVTAIAGTVTTGSYTLGSIGGTGALLLVNKGAEDAEADPGSDEDFSCEFLVELEASATGYTTTLLDTGNSGYGIVCTSDNSASADTGE